MAEEIGLVDEQIGAVPSVAIQGNAAHSVPIFIQTMLDHKFSERNALNPLVKLAANEPEMLPLLQIDVLEDLLQNFKRQITEWRTCYCIHFDLTSRQSANRWAEVETRKLVTLPCRHSNSSELDQEVEILS